MREIYLDGSVGQAVSGLVWLASATAGTWIGVREGIVVLVAGGVLIFPLTKAALRLLRRPTSVGADNPLTALATQVAFVVPLLLPLVGAATLHRIEWFYPAMMMVVGAHYLPFVFLYGMRSFAVLAAALLAGGVALGLGTESFTAGGWAGGGALLAFALLAGLRRRNGTDRARNG
jgi:hypothetical protein